LLAPETSLWVPVFIALGCVVVLTPE
jgi:hypothetical protein